MLEKRLNSTRCFDVLKEQESNLFRLNEEDQAIINDDDAAEMDKEAAQARIAARNEELARLKTDIVEREEAMPLRERIKEIFKKHGVTVTAILLAAGVTIGVVVSSITKGLKATGEAMKLSCKDSHESRNLRCLLLNRGRQNVVRTSVTHSAIASCATFLFLPHFDIICDLLKDRCTATWNLFVK